MMKTLVHNKVDHTLSLQDRSTLSASVSDVNALHLVQVHATSFTNGELLWPEVNELSEPVPGYDVAGTILSAPGGSRFKPGDSVFGYTSVERPGAAREHQVALASELAAKPDALSWEEAATVPLSALTAWQALFIHAGLRSLTESVELPTSSDSRTRVLVTAASGGVGVWVVQLARLAGLHVVATCGPRNVDFVKQLGADEVLDYNTTPVGAWTAEDPSRAFDVIIDCKGGDTLKDAWTCVKRHGFISSVAEPADDLKPASGVAEHVRSKWFIVEPNGAQLERIARLLEDGQCQAVVDSVHDFKDWQEAFDRLSSGHARGKVVLRVKQ